MQTAPSARPPNRRGGHSLLQALNRAAASPVLSLEGTGTVAIAGRKKRADTVEWVLVKRLKKDALYLYTTHSQKNCILYVYKSTYVINSGHKKPATPLPQPFPPCPVSAGC